ncbi:cyclic nucleotide-binding/CBS domain-containing protein [Streptomyces sp. NPDC093595]|uniref:CBS domain-containing protein n=1 Tax=Streptomyces sp. NPDC093595 TaxID=3366045 RepID=UPI00380B261F
MVTGETVVRGNGRVADACTKDPVSVSPEDDVDHAAALMRQHTLTHLAVMEDGMPVGIICRDDLVPPHLLPRDAQLPAPANDHEQSAPV